MYLGVLTQEPKGCWLLPSCKTDMHHRSTLFGHLLALESTSGMHMKCADGLDARMQECFAVAGSEISASPKVLQFSLSLQQQIEVYACLQFQSILCHGWPRNPAFHRSWATWAAAPQVLQFSSPSAFLSDEP
jgi:hypothetical protein